MTTTTGATIKVLVHFGYKGDAGWQADFPGEQRPTYADGIIGWSNAVTATTNGPVVLETQGGMYTDQPFRDSILTPKLANHYGMRIYAASPLTDEERPLFEAAQAAGFAISDYVG